MKKFISFALLLALLLSLGACSIRVTKPTPTEQFPTDAEGNPLQPSDAKISPDQAQEIAREALGITKEQMLSPFVHIGSYGENNESCYAVMFATLDYDYEFVISAITGEVLYRSDKVEQTQPTEGSAND